MNSKNPYAIIAVSEGVTNEEIQKRVKGRETSDQFGNVFLAKLNIGKELTIPYLFHLQLSGLLAATQ